MRRLNVWFFAMMVILGTGCGTVKATDNHDTEVLSAQELQALSYRDVGEIESSNEIYRQLIAANPKSFKSVLYQHEIMRNAEASSDPRLLVEEIKRTVQLFNTAIEENYEGATPEAIQRERDALDRFVYEKSFGFYQVKHKTNNSVYALYAKDIYEIYKTSIGEASDECLSRYYHADLAYFSEDYKTATAGYTNVLDNCQDISRSNQVYLNMADGSALKKACLAHYYYAELAYFGEDYETAALNYTNVLDNCKNESDADIPDYYIYAAHGTVLAYDHIIKDRDKCPKPENSCDLDDDASSCDEIPVAECRMKFIDAAQRFGEIVQSGNYEKMKEYANNAVYTAGKLYYDHNQYEKAIPLFQRVIERVPKSDAAVFAADYLLTCYKRLKQYAEIQDVIRMLKNNPEFMANESEWMPDFTRLMNEYEEVLKSYVDSQNP